MKISYIEQTYPRGLPDAFILGEKFIGKNNVTLILGDNFFYGQSLSKTLLNCIKIKSGAKVLLHKVSKPELYGVMGFGLFPNSIWILRLACPCQSKCF